MKSLSWFKFWSTFRETLLVSLLITIPTYIQVDNDFQEVKEEFNFKSNGETTVFFDLKNMEPFQFEVEYRLEAEEENNALISIFVNHRSEEHTSELQSH